MNNQESCKKKYFKYKKKYIDLSNQYGGNELQHFLNKYGGAEEQTRDTIDELFDERNNAEVDIKQILDSVNEENTDLLNYALLMAVIYNKRDIIKYLVNTKNVNINAIIDDTHVLHEAVVNSNPDSSETMKLLIKLKANVNFIARSVTPLISAIWHTDREDGSIEKIQLLLKKMEQM